MADFIRHYATFWTEPGPTRYPAGYQGIPKWARVRTKREAERLARTVGGYVVAVSYGARMAWDAPTFKVSGEIVADYRRAGR